MKNKYKYPSFQEFILIYITVIICCTASLMIYLSFSPESIVYKWNPIVALGVLGYIFFTALVITLIINFLKQRYVTTPIKKINDSTSKIANGDFNAKIEYKPKKKKDYIENLYENFNKMVDELASTEMLKSDFISNVSHEIKTPLAVIQSYSMAIQDGDISSKKQKEYLDIIVKQSEKLSILISNILKLNKLENQEILPNKKIYYVSEQIKESIISMESLWTEKKIKVITDIDDVKIYNDDNILELVWNNLISNAIKYTEKKGKIFISVKEENNHIIIKIQDNGCGMSEETIHHIYDKFYQGDTSHSKEGNGLGLSLVSRALQITNGSIDVESELGKGTTFTIILKND